MENIPNLNGTQSTLFIYTSRDGKTFVVIHGTKAENVECARDSFKRNIWCSWHWNECFEKASDDKINQLMWTLDSNGAVIFCENRITTIIIIEANFRATMVTFVVIKTQLLCQNPFSVSIKWLCCRFTWISLCSLFVEQIGRLLLSLLLLAMKSAPVNGIAFLFNAIVLKY